MSKSLVLLSGGQDSVTCLGLALLRNKTSDEPVHAISFNYGQKHSVEIECAKKICQRYGIHHKIVDISFFGDMVYSALTDRDPDDVNSKHPDHPDLPASFVPNRNALLLTLAHAWAQTIKADKIIAGMCQTDYPGYPDCRKVFIDGLATALNIGSNSVIPIETPLMNLNKAEIFELAEKVDFLDEVIENSHTCYNGDRSILRDYGYGCGDCPACKLRKNGYERFIFKKKDYDDVL